MVLFVAVELPSHGMLVPIEGRAELRILLATDSYVVCAVSVSGNPLDSVLAIEGRSGGVMWRTSASRVSKAGAGIDGMFWLIANDGIEKRSLSTGKVIWTSQLDSIPKQTTEPRKSLKERAEELMEKIGIGDGSRAVTISAGSWCQTPNSYRYSEPILTGSRVLLTREANWDSGGCVVMGCFEDWLLLDAATGKLVTGGSGGMFGKTYGTMLVGSRTGIFRVSRGDAEEIDISALPRRSVVDARSASHYIEQLSSKESCAFELVTSVRDEMVYYDDRTRRMRAFALPKTRSEYQSQWVLMGSQLLRYSQCSRHDAPKTLTPMLWFELYDLDGKRLQEVEVPVSNETEGLGWVNFVSKSADSVQFEHRGARISVAVPSLAVTSNRLIRPHLGRSYGSEAMSPSGDAIFETFGTTNFSKMPTVSFRYDLVLERRSPTNGGVRWRHVERVKVKSLR